MVGLMMAGRFLTALLAVTLSGCGIGAVLPDNNFHAIVAGEAYRSAQPSPDELMAYSKTYGIATVLNLRGAQTRRAWYRDEIRTAEQLGIRHVDFAMSPVKELAGGGEPAGRDHGRSQKAHTDPLPGGVRPQRPGGSALSRSGCRVRRGGSRKPAFAPLRPPALHGNERHAAHLR